MCRVRRCALQSRDDHPLHVNIADRAWLARSRLVMQAIHAALSEPAPPLTHRRRVTTQTRRYVLAVLAPSRGQHDPTAQRQGLRTLRTPGPPLKDLALLIA